MANSGRRDIPFLFVRVTGYPLSFWVSIDGYNYIIVKLLALILGKFNL